MQYSIWAHSFAGDGMNTATCSLEERTWTRVHDQNHGAKRLFAKISFGATDVFCALGNPIAATEIQAADPKLFVPPWVLDQLCLDGTGEVLNVEWMSEESFPEATRIVLRPHDSAFYHADAKEELERVLTQMGILKQGVTIPVGISALGGYEILFDVVKTEPAELVLMEGDEVALEFEAALDEAPMAYEPPATAPLMTAPMPPPTEEPFDTDSMIPTALPVPPVGNVLGGTVRPKGWNPWRDQPKTAAP